MSSSLLIRAQLFHPLEEGRAPFVRISVDPTVPLKTFLQKANISGFEATIDSEIKQNLFLIGGMGYINARLNEEDYVYSNSGMFGVFGADLNLTKYVDPSDRDIFFVGFHYGFAALSHEATDIKMNNYWGDYYTSVPRESHFATWVEVAMGVKAEVGKNIFIGWTGEVKFRNKLTKGEMIPYVIPGYGKNNESYAFDLSLFVSYAFTMKPKKRAVIIEPTE